VSSGVDAAYFFIVFVAGSIGVLLLKEMGVNRFVVTAIPCALLVLYALSVYWIPRFRLREDQAGDNCYYLGFLFTLVSLAHALVSFVRAGGTEKIVEDFGIALATTIFGLVLRVAFNQMRQDPVEIEREARLELAEAAQRLRSELDQSVLEMNSFRRSTQQSIADGLIESNAKIGEVLEKNLARYDEITVQSAERIDRTLAAFAENAQRLNGLTEKTAAAIEALTIRIEAIKAPENLVENKLAPAADAVVEVANQLRQRAEAETAEFRQLRKLVQRIGAATEGIEARITTIDEVLASSRELGEALIDAGRRLGELTENFDHVGSTLAENSKLWREELAHETKIMGTKISEASSEIAAAGDALRQFVIDPARVAGAALTAIGEHASTLKEIEARLKRLPKLLEEQVAAIERIRKAYEDSRSGGFFGRRLW
jgi:methyl-accepting chemotaxis protein